MSNEELEMAPLYSHDEVLESATNYFNGDSLAGNVWTSKYALKNSDGEYLEKDPSDMHRRLSKEFARIESNYSNPLSEGEIFDLLDGFKYIIPQGSPMAGIGNNEQLVSISNCFYVGNQGDSYGSIMRIDEELVQLCKRRAGVGTTLEHIRPDGSKVSNAAITSSGTVPFMSRYGNSIKEVATNGRRK